MNWSCAWLGIETVVLAGVTTNIEMALRYVHPSNDAVLNAFSRLTGHKIRQHDDVFGRIATRYELLCDVFSLGFHRLWKRRIAQIIASEHWATLLDGAAGTGGIIARLLAHEAVLARTVIASDISTEMLAIAQRKLAPFGDEVRLRQLDAESMPTVADSSVDAYSMSFGLKICNRDSVLKKAYRIL